MSLAVGIAFLLMASLFLAITVLGLLRTGLKRLEGSIGITRDGFPPGKPLPSWQLSDLDGQIHETPAHSKWQLLIFIDHALVSFPELVTSMNTFASETPEAEVLVMSRDDATLCKITQEVLNLQVSFIAVEQSFYDRFRVRVMPFAFLVDPLGVVRQLGLVNNHAQLSHMWEMSHLVEEQSQREKEVKV